MPIMRNPFRKQDENLRLATSDVDKYTNGSLTKPIDIKEREPAEYKLSGKSLPPTTHPNNQPRLTVYTEINDSGVFIPPSPPEERKSFWTTSSSRSTTSSHTRSSAFNENEPFNISRESFDSYRRSFDISARSPVIFAETKSRSSLDSRNFYAPPRQSNSFHRPLQVPGTQQEEDADSDALEEIALDDPKPAPKKRGMFSRMLDSDSHAERPASQKDGAQKSSWHHFGGRKRGQSGQGAELGDIPRREETPRPLEGQARKEESPLKEVAPVVKDERQTSTQELEQAVPGAEQQSSSAPVVTVNGPS